MTQSKSKMLEPMWDEGLEEKGLATLSDVEDGEFDLVVDMDDLPAASKAHEAAVKQYLTQQKKTVQEHIDGRKLPQAIALFTATENTASLLSDPEVVESIRQNIIATGDARAYKMVSDAHATMLKQTQNLTRLDTVDGAGTGAKVALAVQFGNGSGGTTVVQVGIEDK
jgi:hypothetical protein